MPGAGPARVAYGLRVTGLVDQTLMIDHPPGPLWPLLELDHTLPAGRQDAGTLDSAVTVALQSGGTLRLAGARATFLGDRPPEEDALVHPHLATAAAGRSRLLGREVLHAGAVVTESGFAWALAGTNETGKSTLVAAFAAMGTTVLTDDILVLDGPTAYAGPRCADLREPAHMPGLLGLRRVRQRRRWRVTLPPSPASALLAGIIFLEWHDAGPALRTVPPAQRLGRIARLRRWPTLPSSPTALLDLAALPAYALCRPRDGLTPSEAACLLQDQWKGE